MSIFADVWSWFRGGIRAKAQHARNVEAVEANRRAAIAKHAALIENTPVIPSHSSSRGGSRTFFESAMRQIKEAELTPQTQKMLVESLLIESGPLDPDWITPYQDWISTLNWNGGFFPILNENVGRKDGSFFPFFRSEQELMILRGMSRIICTTNNHARGGLGTYKSYVIGTGFKTVIKDRDAEGGNERTRAEVEAFFKRWEKINRWSERQQEFFLRSVRDGEARLRAFAAVGESKMPTCRFVWPEQVRRPGTGGIDYTYGKKCDPDDIETVLEFAIHSIDPADTDPDYVNPRDIMEVLRNVDLGVKRGLPDFCWGMRDAVQSAGKVERNVGEGSAIQAAIAYVMQYAMASPSEIMATATADSDWTAQRPFSGNNQTRPVQQFDPGTIIHTSKNETFVPSPYSAGVEGHISTVAMLLRSAAVVWSAPVWWFSGDADTGTFAGQMVAESPSVKHCESQQEIYSSAEIRFLTRILELAIECGAITDKDALSKIEIEQEVTSPAVRDKLKEAQVDQIHVGLAAKSPQQVTREIGDQTPDEVAKEIAEAPKPPAPEPKPGEKPGLEPDNGVKKPSTE